MRTLRSEEARIEFTALRSEIDRRSTLQQALVVLNLAAIAAVVTAATKTTVPQHGTSALESSRGFYLVALIPLFAFALGYLFIDHDKAIHRIGTYIREHIEAHHAFGWQTAREQARQNRAVAARRRTKSTARSGRLRFSPYLLAYLAIFVAPSVLAVVALVGHMHGHWHRVLALALATAITAFHLYQWIAPRVRVDRGP